MRRILAVILSALMFLSVISCAESSDEKQETKENTAADEQSGAVETSESDVLGFEMQDFGNTDFTFASQDGSIWGWGVRDIYVEKESAEPLESAIFQRNLWIRDNFGVTVRSTPVNDITVTAKTQISVGVSDFDAYAGKTNQCAEMSSKGYLQDLLDDEVPYININRDWWDGKTVEGLSVNGRLYYATGDLFTVDNDASTILMFNKTILENHMGQDGVKQTPYELVNNKEWTFDTFRQMMLSACMDVGNDGVQYDKDNFGLTGGHELITAFFYATGLSTAGYDDSDEIYFALNVEKADKYFTWAHEVLYDTSSTMIYHEVGTGVDAGVSFNCFSGGRALFYGENLDKVQGLRSSEIDFGIVPFPKYDASQTEYYTFVNNVGHFVCIPTNCPNLEKSGMILEAMAYKSKSTLTPAYYDINLLAKGTRDAESEPMLDIILSNRIYDLGYVFGWGNNLVSSAFVNVAKSGGGLASGIQKYKKSYEREMKKTIEAYTK